jgi:hypothetical protein
MTDTTAAEATKDVAVELGKAVVRASVQTAVEMTAAIAVLAAGGFVAQKVQARRAKKAHAIQAVK